MGLKLCKTCNKDLDESSFYKNCLTKDGKASSCKSCSSLYNKLYNKTNKIEISLNKKEYYLRNKSKIEAYRKNYPKDKIRETANKTRRKKLLNDPGYRLAVNLRTRLSIAVRGKGKYASALKDLGCSIPELKQYLESKFQPGMSWDNYGSGWHIDHIKPLTPMIKRGLVKEACHYTNLQPLWAYDNFKKNARVLL